MRLVVYYCVQATRHGSLASLLVCVVGIHDSYAGINYTPPFHGEFRPIYGPSLQEKGKTRAKKVKHKEKDPLRTSMGAHYI